MIIEPNLLTRTRKIHTVSRRNPVLKGGYIGMNSHGASAHHINWPYGKRDIAVAKGLSKSARKHTIRHEDVERDAMARGKSYHEAHKLALKAEKKK